MNTLTDNIFYFGPLSIMDLSNAFPKVRDYPKVLGQCTNCNTMGKATDFFCSKCGTQLFQITRDTTYSTICCNVMPLQLELKNTHIMVQDDVLYMIHNKNYLYNATNLSMEFTNINKFPVDPTELSSIKKYCHDTEVTEYLNYVLFFNKDNGHHMSWSA